MRWFSFEENEGKLYYRPQNDNSEPLGFVDVAKCDAIKDSRENNAQFFIQMPQALGGRIYNLLAKNEEERSFWITSLQKYKDRLQLESLLKFLDSDDFEKQVAAIRKVGEVLKNLHNVDQFTHLVNLIKGEKVTDPAVKRELLYVIFHSATFQRLDTVSTKDALVDELIKTLKREAQSKNTELQVNAMTSLQLLIVKHDFAAAKFLSTINLEFCTNFLDKSYNPSIQRKGIQLLVYYLQNPTNQAYLKIFNKKTLPDVMEFLNRIADQEEPIELVQVLKLLAVMSAIEEFKPLMATKESVKIFIDILQRQYKSPDIRAEVGVIFTNLAVKDKLRDVIYDVGGLGIVSFLNQAAKETPPRYVLWKNKIITAQEAPATNFDKEYAALFSKKDMPFKEKLIAMMNIMLKQKRKEFDIPVGLALSDIFLPDEPIDMIIVRPYFVSQYELCVAFKLNPSKLGGKIVVKPAKGVKVGVTVSDITADGQLVVGLDPDSLSPSWIAFKEMPKFNFKVSVTNLSISVEKLLKKFVKMAIKQVFLYPKKFFIGNAAGGL